MTQDTTQDITSVDAPLLQIGGLTKTFGGFTALDNISVDIRKGERFGLIGPNGSGKTTLINCISGAFRTEAGTVVFRDEDITIIMIEHIMQAVMRFSERVMCLDAGRIIALGAPDEVMANKRVQEAYLGT